MIAAASGRVLRSLRFAALAALVASVIASSASAQSLTWGASGTGGTGTWNTSNLNWFNGANVAWPASGTAATFAGTSGTVTISGSVQATDLTFTTSGYNLTSGTLGLVKATAPTISLASGITGTIGSIVTGTRGFTLSGGGALTLAGANIYTGTTTITSSTLSVASTNGLGNTTSTIVNNGVLNLSAGQVTYGGISGTMTGSGTANVSNIGAGSASTLLNGNFSGFTGVWNLGVGAAAGAGKVQMNGADNAAATINVLTNATLFVSGGTKLASVFLNGGDTGETIGQLRLESNAIWSGTVTLAGAITTGNDGFIGSNGVGTISGPIVETGGSRALSKVGSGVIALSGSNTYTGQTLVRGGGLQLVNTYSLYGGNTSNWTASNIVVSSGAGVVLTIGGSSGFTTTDYENLRALGTGSTGFLAGSGIGMTPASGTLTYSGVIANNANSIGFYKAGNGTVVLTGSNTYTGNTTLNGGGLSAGNANAFGNGTLVLTSGTLDNASGAALTLAGTAARTINGGFTFAGTNPLNLGTGTVTLSTATITVASSTLTLGPVVGGGVTLSKSGAGQLSLSSGTTVLNAITLNAGTLDLGAADVVFNAGGGTALSGATGVINASGGGRLVLAPNPVGNGPDWGVTGGNTLTINAVIANGTAVGTYPIDLFNSGTIVFTAQNTFNGGVQMFGTRLVVPSIGNSGSASPLGTSGTIRFGGTGYAPLTYTGTGETTNKVIDLYAAAAAGAVIENNGTGLLTFTANLAHTGTGVQALQLQGSGTGEFAGVIDNSINGPLNFTKAGTGLWTLSGSNTYSGFTTVSGGVLAVGSPTALGSSGTSALTLSGGQLDLGTTTQTFGSVTISAPFSSGDVLRNGTLSGTSFAVTNTTGTVTMSAPLIGTGGLTKSGSGTLVVSASNGYTGPTIVSGGVLAISGTGTLGTSGTLTLAGGQLDLGGDTRTFDSFTISAPYSSGTALVNGTLSANSFAATNNTSTAIIGATLTGTGSLTKTGSGVLLLAGSNTYTGTTAILGGALSISSTSALPGISVPGQWNVASGAALAVSNSVDDSQVATLVATGNIAANGAIGFDTTDGDRTYASNIGALQSTLGLAKVGANTLFLTASNGYTGPTQVYGGTLQFTTRTALYGGGTSSWTAANITTATGATLAVNVGGAGEFTAADVATLAALGTGSTGFLPGSTIGLDTTNASGTFTYNTIIANPGGNVRGLVKLGANTLRLGTNSTYTGPTTIAGGTLSLAGTYASPTYLIQAPGSALVLDTGTVASRDYGVATTFTGSGNLIKTGTGNATWGPAATFALASTGTIDVQQGTFTGGNGANEVWTNNQASLNVASGAVFNGVEASIRVNSLTGSGTITSGFSSPNGTFTFGVANGSGTFAGSLRNGTAQNLGWVKLGTGTQALTGANTYTGTTSIQNGVLQLGAGGSTGSLAVGANTLITGSAAGTFAVNRSNTVTQGTDFPTVLTGSIAFAQIGTGTTILNSSSNAYQGGTRVEDGELRLGNAGALGSTAGSLAVNGGTLNLNGLSPTVGAFSGLSAGVVNSASPAILTTSSTASTTFAGSFTGVAGLTQNGTGLLELTGSSSSTGTFTVNSGSLAVNGVLGTGPMSVAAAGWLQGTGTIGGAVNVLGTLSPGNSPGVITLGSVTLGASSTTIIEIDDLTRGTQYDGVNITGTTTSLTYGGLLSLNFGNLSAFDNGTVFDVFNFAGGYSGTYTTVSSTGFYIGTWADIGGGQFRLVSGAQTLTFDQATGDIIVVPEPAAIALAGLGIAGVAAAIRRRLRKSPAAATRDDA